MSAIERNLKQIWEQLRSQRTMSAKFLEQVEIRNLRGISDLQVSLPYPVCVLAGANGCGKSTVLFALACAYQQPGYKIKVSPARFFPSFSPEKKPDSLHDDLKNPELIFAYTDEGRRESMSWKRSKRKWNASFFGRKNGRQPILAVYIHTLANMSNPSEVRSFLQLAQRNFETAGIDISDIAFAQRILQFRYAKISQIKERDRYLLFAERANVTGDPNGVYYSEFHMSAGERALIRLSINLSKLENALVLIDEVEAGLHPQVQQLLMLELQRLALRNHLQIVVTSHSPTVLETVPMDARIFLERAENNVIRKAPYRDIIQRALYGQSRNKLKFLCEDEEAEAFVRGLLDIVGPDMDLTQHDVEVGRDTGKDQFLAHLETLANFDMLDGVVFVLDGDGASVEDELKKRGSEKKQPVTTLLLPGREAPEAWAWKLLDEKAAQYSGFFGLTEDALRKEIAQLNAVFDSAASKPAEIAKGKIGMLSEKMAKTTAELFRHIGKTEAASKNGEVYELVNGIKETIGNWRTAKT